MRIVFNTLEGSYALCLLANLLQLAFMERDGALKDLSFPTFTVLATATKKLLLLIQCTSRLLLPDYWKVAKIM